MTQRVVITGIGMVTPLGKNHKEVVRRIQASESAAAPPTRFDASPFACPVCAQMTDFRPQDYVAEPKMVRLMNRDAQLAVAAAHLALEDAGLKAGGAYQPEEIALYGATGLAGLPLGEVAPLIRNSTGPDGVFDSVRFGQRGLKSISPLLSFKILGNMPVCFVSICENLKGPNCIYTPWEGQGAQAIEAGVRAVQNGKAPCAVVGGCDVKTHELAFIALEQRGLFETWRETKAGMVPGEGAVFLVLEAEENAVARGARCYACLAGCGFATQRGERERTGVFAQALTRTVECAPPHPLELLVCAADGDPVDGHAESEAMSSIEISARTTLYPKQQAGNLFAAAAALQVAVGALFADQLGGRVLANCFGYGSEQAAFLLEKP